MFRTVLRFGFALGHDEYGRLDERLKTQRFEKGGAREEEITYIQAAAFVRTALQLGATGVNPLERGRCIAIGVAAQFELTLRQKDIIGDWQPAIANVPHAIYAGSEMWVAAFRWDNIPGWRFRLKTSKTRRRLAFRSVTTLFSSRFSKGWRRVNEQAPLLRASAVCRCANAAVGSGFVKLQGLPASRMKSGRWIAALAVQRKQTRLALTSR
jgi:hypothetical protein